MSPLHRSRTLLAVAAVMLLVADPGTVTSSPRRVRMSEPASGTPDLVVNRVSRLRVGGDWQALTISGTMTVDVMNGGDLDSGPFEVALFEDTDGDDQPDPATDNRLGAGSLAGLAPGEVRQVVMPVSGRVLFRDNLVYALADSTGVVDETDEDNNWSHTGLACSFRPAVGAFEPTLEWEWTGSTVMPAWHEVMMTPAVIDLDGNGVPDVVFSTYVGQHYETNGVLRAVRGDDGSELFTVTDPRYRVAGEGCVATADLDGDAHPEIVAVDETGKAVMAFEHDGAFSWRSAPILPWVREGGASIADLDGNGVPEIVVGSTALNSDGSVRFAPRAGARGRGDNGWGPVSVIADLDLDGVPEIVAGNTAYRADGQVLWQARTQGDAFDAVANFDADPFPEIVMVSRGDVYVVEHDGRIKWGPRAIPGGSPRGSGGPPTVGDVDGDGWPEIGVAGSRSYAVFETNGSLKWSQPTQDLTSAVTGSSVFDFEGDGSAEVLYGDELRLRIYRGRDGKVLWDVPRSDGTTYDMPLVVDVDADGNAEIVVISNELISAGSHGVHVYGDASDSWVPTRQIWNQHAYHIGNINDDGSVPAVEAPSWQSHNTYRMNLPPGGNPFAAPDVTASKIEADGVARPGVLSVTARIGNGGAILAAAGLPIAFYDGDPAGAGLLVGVAHLQRDLLPGQWADVNLAWRDPRAGAIDLYVEADDDGTRRGTASECDETNNVHHISAYVAPSPTPSATSISTPTTTATETSAPTATTWPTPLPIPTASATQRPTLPNYLPLALREQSLPKRRSVDLVLVVDASSSMSGAKLASARAAANAILAMADPDLDQAALVVFHDVASLAVPLTGDMAPVSRAVGSISTDPGTRIDRGLETALQEITGPRHRSVSTAVIALLSDGQPSVDGSVVVASARRVRDHNVIICAIGVGADANAALLLELVAATDLYLHEPALTALQALYRKIADVVPCDPWAFWGRRCA